MGKDHLEFDHHTHSWPSQAAIEQMTAHFYERSPQFDLSSLYTLVDAASDDLFVFTSSAAEAVATVIWSIFSEVSSKEGKTQFITSSIEDAPTLQMLKRCEMLGCGVKIAPVDRSGRIDVSKLATLITPRTALISVSAAQGLTGVIQPVEEISRIAKERNVLLHLDASYAIGNTYFSFQNTLADYLTFSGERIHSVKGSGGLFAKKEKPLLPFILGRQDQTDAPSLAALCVAARFARLALDTLGLEGARLRNLFETEIQTLIPDTTILFKNSPRLPNTVAIAFPRVHHEALHYYLERKGLYVNSGTDSQHLRGLLVASGIEEEGALSFSLSRMTKQEDVLRAVKIIGEEVFSLQKLSEDLSL